MKFNITFLILTLVFTSGSCFGIKMSGSSSLGEIELSGKFDSKKGVMHKISCHGYNIGYLTVGSEKIVVCFDRLINASDLEIDCSEIRVKGHYEKHSVSGGEGVCQAGTISVFYVSSWHCKGSEGEINLNGKFDSKKGVMDEISCYGYNIGYLTSGSEKIVVCFDRLKNASDLDIDCSEVMVKGQYEEYSLDIIEGEEGVCRPGTRTIFYVSEYKCN